MLKDYKKIINEEKRKTYLDSLIDAQSTLAAGDMLIDSEDKEIAEKRICFKPDGVTVDGKKLIDYLSESGSITSLRRFENEEIYVINSRTVLFDDYWNSFNEKVKKLEDFVKEHPKWAKVLPKGIVLWYFCEPFPQPFIVKENTITLKKYNKLDSKDIDILHDVAKESGEETFTG